MDKFKFWAFCGLLTIACGLSGCEQVDKESLNKIIQGDPSFKEVLTKKDELDSKINLLLNQLQEAKAGAYANIRGIQENLNKQKTEIDSKVGAFKKALDPERAGIREKMEALTSAISTKTGMLKNLEGTKRNLVNLINQQKAANATPEEMSKWQERLAALEQQIEPLKGEVRELQEELRTFRIKLMALRQ